MIEAAPLAGTVIQAFSWLPPRKRGRRGSSEPPPTSHSYSVNQWLAPRLLKRKSLNRADFDGHQQATSAGRRARVPSPGLSVEHTHMPASPSARCPVGDKIPARRGIYNARSASDRCATPSPPPGVTVRRKGKSVAFAAALPAPRRAAPKRPLQPSCASEMSRDSDPLGLMRAPTLGPAEIILCAGCALNDKAKSRKSWFQ